MTPEEKKGIRDAILAVADDASIIFFDMSAIDLEGVELWVGDSREDTGLPPTFIPVHVPYGKTVKDCVYAVSAAQVKKEIQEIESCH